MFIVQDILEIAGYWFLFFLLLVNYLNNKLAIMLRISKNQEP